MLADEYPSNFRFSTCVFPSPEADDVNVGPYNSMLALNCLIEYADCILPVENQQLYDIVKWIDAQSEKWKGSKNPFGGEESKAPK